MSSFTIVYILLKLLLCTNINNSYNLLNLSVAFTKVLHKVFSTKYPFVSIHYTAQKYVLVLNLVVYMYHCLLVTSVWLPVCVPNGFLSHVLTHHFQQDVLDNLMIIFI